MERGGWVYITSNSDNKVLYTGVTSNLRGRIFDHKDKKYVDSFTAKFNMNKLVYYKAFFSIEEAIIEKKKIKGGSRKGKIQRIESMNPDWNELFSEEMEV
ncbi:MAG: putative endonuclease [Glaciecola sp.]|jgi:putative endonuclease